jgi:hypothetical protein
VEVADVDSAESGIPCGRQTAKGMGAGCRGKIIHKKMRGEGQQIIRNFRVKISDKLGQCRDLGLVDS